ncbi:MAG: M50 family metallopeptidase [Caulobacteraceae bacterium]
MLEFAQTALIYVVPFLLILTLIVTVHEMAHYLTARAFGTAVDRFSIGFGPKLFSWKGNNGMEWWISALPLGGYVKFSGDDSVASVPDAEDLKDLKEKIVREKGVQALSRYFHFKPIWQRALIVAAGPISNLVLASVIFAGMLLAFGTPTSSLNVVKVYPGSPAERAGMLVGDRVVEVRNKPVRNYGEFKTGIVLATGDALPITVRRGDQTISLTAVPERAVTVNSIGGKDRMGVIGIDIVQRDFAVIRYNPIEALAAGVTQTGDVIRLNFTYIGRWIRGAENGDQIRGPVGMAQATGGVAKLSASHGETTGEKVALLALNMISMAAVISVAVGIINLMPIPMLDGGHLLFYAYESAARRPLGGAAQAMGYRVGLALILGLVLFATWNDVQQLRLFQMIGGALS